MGKWKDFLCSPPNLIACRVCGRVFLDNLSLVFHFECHLNLMDKTPSLGQHTSLKGDRALPMHSSISSFIPSSMGERERLSSRAYPLHFSSALGQKFSAAQPISNASFPLQVKHTTMFKKRSAFGGSSPTMLNGPCGNNLRAMQHKMKPVKEEVVVVSDDEEKEEIDLTLKL